MKNKMPILIMSVGIAILVISWVQWWFLYPDKSNLFLGTIGGACFIGGGYIYYWMRKKEENDEKRDKRIDDLVKIYTKHELD